MTGQMNYQSWRSLTDMFSDRAADLKDKPFLWAKRNGAYESLSWSQVEAQISVLSRGLRAIGVEPGDRIVLASENRPEWLISELAILSAGAIAVPAYVTNTVDDHLHIINNVDAKGAIVSTPALAAHLLPAAHKSNVCRFVVAMKPPELSQELGGVEIHGWDDVIAKGATMPDDVAELAGRAARKDTAVIIHTSGTGGAPKGVMLSHGAIIVNCMGAYELIKDQIGYGEEVFLSFLPLSHSYEHTAGQFFPVSIGAQIYYSEGIEALVGNMAEARPTVMTAVPRLYEVMHGRIVGATQKTKGIKRKLFDRALELGKKKYLAPASLSFGERIMDAVVERLVRRKVRGRFGGRLKFFVSGGAPLNEEIGLFFTALGVKLLQGYGQTEAAPVISANPPVGYKIDTVGPPLKDVEVKIADDGEILVKGELVMNGYYNDDDGTRAAVRDGWLHTGDIGLIGDDGHLRITDRKKDIIVNSGGDNISPQRVEGLITLQPEIGQAMVYGDKRPHLVAIVVPEDEAAASWAKSNGKAADLKELAADAEFHEVIAETMGRVNQELSNVERVRRFMIASEPFTTDNGMLTPSMKIRRHVIKDTYGAALDALYTGG